VTYGVLNTRTLVAEKHARVFSEGRDGERIDSKIQLEENSAREGPCAGAPKKKKITYYIRKGKVRRKTLQGKTSLTF